MPQSLARLHLHLIFSTKNREPFISDDIRKDLHAYMAKVLQNRRCPSLIINSMNDHVHLLFDLARTVTVSQAVEEVKKASSKWIKNQNPRFANFAWQAGYGIFAVSESNVADVRAYIANQAKHHQKKTFQDEYRAFLTRHAVTFDERYVWV